MHPRQHHTSPPAAIRAGAQPDRKRLGLPARQQTRHLHLRQLRPHRREVLRRVELLRRRQRDRSKHNLTRIRKKRHSIRPLVSQAVISHQYLPAEMLGWVSSCECNAPTPVPATVLDPFGSAGTVGLVAERMCRDSITIEISPDYADIAQRRIMGDAPLLTDLVFD